MLPESVHHTTKGISDLQNIELSKLMEYCGLQIPNPNEQHEQYKQSSELRSQQYDHEVLQQQYLHDGYQNKQNETDVILEVNAENNLNSLNLKDKHELCTSSNSVVSLAKVFITLSTKYFATEPLLQGVLENIYSAFSMCRYAFVDNMLRSHISEDNKSVVKNIFNNSFNSFIYALNPTTGILRNTYNRKIYYTKTLKYVAPKQITIQDIHQDDTSYIYSYIPILKTLEVMLLNKNVRKYFNDSNLKNNTNDLFDINDGTVVKGNSFFNEKKIVKVALLQDAFNVCNPLGSQILNLK